MSWVDVDRQSLLGDQRKTGATLQFDIGVPALEAASEVAIGGLRTGLEEKVRAHLGPTHSLLVDHAARQ